MRITSSQLYDNLLSGVNKQLKVQADANASIASGKRFQTPAQAGIDYKVSLDLRHTQSQLKGSFEALIVTDSRLGATQSVLTDMIHVLGRAQALAVQQSSANMTTAEHQAAANEVKHLLDQVANSANKAWEGDALFSGTAINQQAFVQDAQGFYQYQGSAQDRVVAISNTQQVVSNVRGDEPAFALMFDALKTFQNALENDEGWGIGGAIGDLSKASNGMIDLTSRVGGQINALSSYRQSYEDMQFAIEKRLNEHETADIPALVAEMQQANIALQASYSQIANMKNLSLVNFLR
ncbi:MAG: hypothetical protein Q9M19_08325 [Mariprofundaceae bacterium]|nr:hypothetical protein [Mariprofundaceae bacterium]